MEAQQGSNANIDDSKKKIRKKYVVYPLMEYLVKENQLMSSIPVNNYNKTLFIYGFHANTKKKVVTDYVKRIVNGVNMKCTIRSFHRPIAIILFLDEKSCENAYNIIHKDLKRSLTDVYNNNEQILWSVAKATNYNQRIPLKKKLDRSKIILRNLPFSIKEEEIYNIFKFYGPVVSIKFPTRIGSNGKLVRKGCCFVQYCRENDAIRAIQAQNEKIIKNRPIIVDIAVKKELYEKQPQDDINERELSIESENSGDISKISDDNEKTSTIQEKNSSEQLLQWEISTKPDEDKVRNNNHVDNNELIQRTVFVKNISWITQPDNFKRFMEEKFGETEFCRFVLDKQFNQPKGTAFVRFLSLDSYNRCINVTKDCINEDAFLDGKILEFLPALTRDQLANKKLNDNNEEQNNNRRNLNLVSLGLAYRNDIDENMDDNESIFYGSMLNNHEKKIRADALKAKQAKLKNTNYFISKTRICVRNIPYYVDESLLSRTYQKLGGKLCQLKKTRLARFKPSGNEKKGKSKGYGFIEFNTHECALRALKLSANQLCTSIFPIPINKDQSSTTKPIPPNYGTLLVEFSIENAQTIKKQIKLKQNIRKVQKNKDNHHSQRFFLKPVDKKPSSLHRKRKINNVTREININN